MTHAQLPAAARDAARSEARRMIAGLMPGQTGINLADELADAVLDAAWPAITATYEQAKTGAKFVAHMRDQDPAQLETDRAEAWRQTIPEEQP